MKSTKSKPMAEIEDDLPPPPPEYEEMGPPPDFPEEDDLPPPPAEEFEPISEPTPAVPEKKDGPASRPSALPSLPRPTVSTSAATTGPAATPSASRPTVTPMGPRPTVSRPTTTTATPAQTPKVGAGKDMKSSTLVKPLDMSLDAKRPAPASVMPHMTRPVSDPSSAKLQNRPSLRTLQGVTPSEPSRPAPARPKPPPERPRFNGVDSIDLLMRQEGDDYVMMGKLKEQVKDCYWIFLLTPKSLYKFPPVLATDPSTTTGAPSSPSGSTPESLDKYSGALEFRKKKDIMDIHSVRPDPDDPFSFRVLSYKSKAKQTKNKLFGALGYVTKFETFLQTRIFKASSQVECMQWVVVFNKLIRDRWQQMCEEKIILNQEIYQRHVNVMKLNLHKKVQERVLVLSTDWIYNTEATRNPTTIKDVKWAYPIVALIGIAISYNNQQEKESKEEKDSEDVEHSAATFYFDKELILKSFKSDSKRAYTLAKRQEKEINDSHTFFFSDDTEMVHTVLELRRLFYRISSTIRGGRQLKLEVKEQQSVIYKDGSSVELPDVAGQTPAIQGTLLKYTNWGAGSHPRMITIYPSLLIQWKESEKSKVHVAKVMSVMVGNVKSLLKKKLSDDQASRLFTLQTTNKTLQLLAVDSMERDRWVRTIQDLLSHEDLTRPPPAAMEAASASRPTTVTTTTPPTAIATDAAATDAAPATPTTAPEPMSAGTDDDDGPPPPSGPPPEEDQEEALPPPPEEEELPPPPGAEDDDD